MPNTLKSFRLFNPCQGFFGREEAWVAIGGGDDYRIALPCFFGIEARYGEVETFAQAL